MEARKLDSGIDESSPLAFRFPECYRCAMDNQANASFFFTRQGTQIVWYPIFSRDLFEREILQFLPKVELLSDVFILIDRIDKSLISMAVLLATQAKQVLAALLEIVLHALYSLSLASLVCVHLMRRS